MIGANVLGMPDSAAVEDEVPIRSHMHMTPDRKLTSSAYRRTFSWAHIQRRTACARRMSVIAKYLINSEDLPCYEARSKESICYKCNAWSVFCNSDQRKVGRWSRGIFPFLMQVGKAEEKEVVGKKTT